MDDDTEAVEALFAMTSLGAPENAVGFVLWRLVHSYQRAVDRALEPIELTHLQFTMLAMAAWLRRSGRPATQAELARHAEIHPMQVSLMLKTLEAKAMVMRRRDEADTRTKRVHVTTSGLEALRAALPAVIDVQQTVFGPEGMPGGPLLEALLAVERSAASDETAGDA